MTDNSEREEGVMNTTTLTVPAHAVTDAVRQVLRDPVLRSRLRQGRLLELWAIDPHRRPARLRLSAGVNGAVRLTR
jgi:hypothetical protein